MIQNGMRLTAIGFCADMFAPWALASGGRLVASPWEIVLETDGVSFWGLVGLAYQGWRHLGASLLTLAFPFRGFALLVPRIAIGDLETKLLVLRLQIPDRLIRPTVSSPFSGSCNVGDS